MNRVLFVNLLIALAPNVHFLRILHKLVAEIRVGDADQRLRTLPGGQALQVDHAVFRDDVMYTGPGVGSDGAGGQGGNDAALHAAVLAGDGGGHANKTLAALGQVRAHHEIQLPAGA